MSNVTRLAIVLGVAALGAACSNPTVDPASTFTIRGRALKADGMVMGGGQVKLVRYFDQLKLLQPTADAIFTCDTADCSDPQIALELGVVKTVTAGMDGAFEFTVLGADIQAKNGVTDAQGKVEVSNLVLVVVDPTDDTKLSGVFTFDKLFEQADKVWESGDLKLWDSQATADGTNALANGLVHFSWNPPPRPASSAVKNLYRVNAGGANDNRLIVHCRDNVTVAGSDAKFTEGGCESDGAKLFFDVSAWALYAYYSDNGSYRGYVAADGVDYRYRARFTVIGPALQDPRPNREAPGVGGIWAISNDTTAGTGEQSLLGGPAVDGNRSTKADISPAATAIYVLFNQPVYVSDAGLLNAVVADAAGACVVVEFSSNATMLIGEAKKLAQSDWSVAGRFCGATAGAREMSAVLGFDSSSAQSPGRIGTWLRFRLSDDANVTGVVAPTYTAVHEIALFGRKP